MLVLDTMLLYARECIAGLGACVIFWGALRAFYHMLVSVVHKKAMGNILRLELGNSIVLGLEFMVGADIIGSLVQPDYYNLGMLAIIVVIRTILSYFLSIELSHLHPRDHKNI